MCGGTILPASWLRWMLSGTRGVLADTVFAMWWHYIAGFVTAVNVIRDPWCVCRHSVCYVMALYCRLSAYGGCYQGPVVCWQTQCLLCDVIILSASWLRRKLSGTRGVLQTQFRTDFTVVTLPQRPGDWYRRVALQIAAVSLATCHNRFKFHNVILWNIVHSLWGRAFLGIHTEPSKLPSRLVYNTLQNISAIRRIWEWIAYSSRHPLLFNTKPDMFVQLDWFVLRLPHAADILRGFVYDVASVIELDAPSMQRQTCCW
jgi:hypothetical protein